MEDSEDNVMGICDECDVPGFIKKIIPKNKKRPRSAGSGDTEGPDRKTIKPSTDDVVVTYDPSSMYDFTHEEKGMAVIICLLKYKNKQVATARPQAIEDLYQLQQTLTNCVGGLGFKIVALMNEDATIINVEKTLERVAALDHSKASGFMCIVSTHGHEEVKPQEGNKMVIKDELTMYDGTIPVRSLTQLFTAENAPTLKGKPKMFFIQACRPQIIRNQWNDIIDVIYQASDAVDVTNPSGAKSTTKSSSSLVNPQCQLIKEMPIQKDFLLACSCPPGFLSLKRMGKGSWFIYELCQMLRKHGSKIDLVSILDMVAQQVATRYEVSVPEEAADAEIKIDGKKQMPWIASMLDKDVYFKTKSS